MTNSILGIVDARCLLVIGSDTTTAHPIIARRIKYAVKKGARLIIANPREIELREYAHIHLQHRPGTDVALLMGMMKVIVEENRQDKAFIERRCENYDAFKASLADFGLDFVEKTTGVDRQRIIDAARMYASNRPAGIYYAMGITQHTHGTDNVLALSNLALLTGNIGLASAGVNPLRGQNNVQGACDMGALPNVFPGYQKVQLPELRKKFETAWGTPLPGRPGKPLLQIFDSIYTRDIKALYIVGENPLLSEANANHARAALERLSFLMVQDIFLTETAQMADVVLPAATFAEKNGTFTNTERRVQRIRKAIVPIGESRPDYWIVCELARRMGAKGFHYSGPEEIMQEIAGLVPQYAGISYARLEKQGLQWPCPAVDHAGTRFLHYEKFATSSGRGRFMPLRYKPSAELPDEAYPFILTTGRSLYHYHTSSMTGRVDGLNQLRPHERLQINPDDAVNLGLENGEMVKVISRRGVVKARAELTDRIPSGLLNMTFHFSDCPTNVLTNNASDPVAGIPETKICAVTIEKL